MTDKLLIINASPRKKGNIAQMVAEMADEAKAHGVETEIVEVQHLHRAVLTVSLHTHLLFRER